MYTDRYPDSKHNNFQTDNPTRNAFSMRLKLPHIPKITYLHWCMTINWDRADRQTCWHSVTPCGSSLPIVFTLLVWLSRPSSSLLSSNWQFRQYSHGTLDPQSKSEHCSEKFHSNPSHNEDNSKANQSEFCRISSSSKNYISQLNDMEIIISSKIKCSRPVGSSILLLWKWFLLVI